MGDSVSEGTIAVWKYSEGQYIHEDEIICVIDTDKVSVDINCPISGEVQKHYAAVGETVMVGESLVDINTAATPVASKPVESITSTSPSEKSDSISSSIPVKSGSLSRENPLKKIDISQASKENVKQENKTSKISDRNIKSTPTLSREENRIPMTRMRQRIAERLKGAQNTAAMLTTFTECDMSKLMNLRAQVNDKFIKAHGVKMGFVSAFMKAATLSLQKMPVLNAYIDDATKEIVYKNYVDISVAVATPNGLTVPVIRNCEMKTQAQLEQDLVNMAAAARNNQITLEDMVGGTFTISNGGVYGSMLSTPIINPPQASILGLHSITKRPVVVDDQIVIRPCMYLALSYDHRLIDGREAVAFLLSIRNYIEDPVSMLLDI